MPRTDLEKSLQSMQASENTAETLASRFHVSRELIFRRFLENGLVSQVRYREAVRKWNSERKIENPSGNFYNNTIAYLGREYIGVALKKYHANQISEEQLADYLNVKVKNLEELEFYYQRGMK